MYFCINFDESESQVSKATITFDLSIPEDAYDYKCSMKGMDACILLEQIQHTLRQYHKYESVPELVLADIADQLDKWKSP